MEGHRTIIQGRNKVTRTADDLIAELLETIRQLMQGREAEYLHLLNFYCNLFADLTKAVKDKSLTPEYMIRNPIWLRAVRGMTLVMNSLLANSLPLKTDIDIQKYEEILSKEHLKVLPLCYNLAAWLHIKENEYVDRIAVEDGKALPVDEIDSDEARLHQQYVDSVAVSRDVEDWSKWMWGRLKYHEKFQRTLRKDFHRRYGISLNDMAAASDFLESFAKGYPLNQVARDTIRLGLANRIPPSRLGGILDALTFKLGSDLAMRPLIPTQRGEFIVAAWIFQPTPMHLEAWVRPILDDQNTESHGLFGNLVGKVLFEDYVEDKIRQAQNTRTIRRRVRVDVRDYPEILAFMKSLKGRKQGFELDLVVKVREYVFLVSCKGGERELPKSAQAKQWVVFPHREIRQKIQNNLEAMDEIMTEAECIASSTNLQAGLGLEDCTCLVPVVVYSVLQPLSMPAIKTHLKCKNVLVTTARGLAKVLVNPDKFKEFFSLEIN